MQDKTYKPGGSYRYSKEVKVNALKKMCENSMNAELTGKELSIDARSLRRWSRENWGKMVIAEFMVDAKDAIANKTIEAVLKTKVDYIRQEVALNENMTDLLNKVFDRMEEMIPNERNLDRLTNLAKFIVDIGKPKKDQDDGGNGYSENTNTILQLVKQQLVVVRPEIK